MAKAMTMKQICMERLTAMKPTDFVNEESFTIGGRPQVSLGTVLHSTLSEFNRSKLSAIIFAFLKKWPQNRNHTTLRNAAVYLIYGKHYNFFHRRDAPQSVIDSRDEYVKVLSLSDTKHEYIKDDGGKNTKKRKPKDSGDEVALKLRDMDIKEMLKWESDAGVPKDLIKKHKELHGRNKGIAKMNIGNAIRKALKSKEEAK